MDIVFYILILFAYEASSAEIKFSEEELRKRLTPMQYHVTQEKGTERYGSSDIQPYNSNHSLSLLNRAFTGELTYNKNTGIYSCVVCGENLFK